MAEVSTDSTRSIGEDEIRAERVRLSPRAVSWMVFAGYVAFTLWFTWPLILHMGSSLYGASGDLTGGIANLREMLHHFPLAPGRILDFGAPEGLVIAWPLNIATFSSTLPMWLLAKAFGPVAAFNILVLSGHLATAQATFLLARRLTRHIGASVIAGWAYAFFPFMVINSRGHDAFIHGWVFVLVLWRMIEFGERPSRRNGLLAGIAAVLCWAWNPYFLLIGGVLTMTLVAAELIRAVLKKDIRRCVTGLAWGAIPIAIYVVIVGVATREAPTSGTRVWPIEALNVYGARSAEYVVPHSTSLLFGNLTKNWISTHIHGSNGTEATLYLGGSVLLLALVGLWAALSGRIRLPHSRFNALLLLAISFFAFGASAPPSVPLPILGLVHMPSFYVYQYVSTSWRVYSRFVLLVMLGVVLLAAYGIAWLANRRSFLASSLVLVLIGTVVVVDLWQESGHRWVTSIGYDSINNVLERQRPRGIVAEYPMEPFGYGDYSAEFDQDRFGMPILNGYGENTPEEWRAMTLTKLSDPQTPRKLATLGVRYVLNTHVPIEAGVQDPGRPGRGLKKIAATGYATLYRVTAVPEPSVIIGATGFDAPDLLPGVTEQWMSGSSGDIDIHAACARCGGTFKFIAASLGAPRKVSVYSRGKQLVTLSVLATGSVVTVPITIRDRCADVTLRVSPGPKRISDVLGGADTRLVSVMVRNMSFTPAAGSSR